MAPFAPVTARFAGTIQLNGPVSQVFELFSPEGERLWVPGWAPELLHPRDVVWAQGQIFRTQEENQPAIWVVARLDREAHDVEYYRIERDRYVARVAVNCASVASAVTAASVIYEFIGLTERGNNDIAAMSEQDYSAKMARWTGWINAHLRNQSTRG